MSGEGRTLPLDFSPANGRNRCSALIERRHAKVWISMSQPPLTQPRPDLNTLFCQTTDITPLLAKFKRPWHYASGGRDALRRVWVAALRAAARSASRAAAG